MSDDFAGTFLREMNMQYSSIKSVDELKVAIKALLDELERSIDNDYYPRNVQGVVLNFVRWSPVTFDHPKGDATSFIEMKNGKFNFVISERGKESKRAVGNKDHPFHDGGR